MKRLLAILLSLLLILSLVGCAKETTASGTVQWCREDKAFFGLALEDGSIVGLVITDKTKLVFEDDGVIYDACAQEQNLNGWQVLSQYNFSAQATVSYGEETEGGFPGYNHLVSGWFEAKAVTVTGKIKPVPQPAAKPVIYLYPEEETEVTVQLDCEGELTCVYPAYDGAWRVTAAPDGTLTDEKGQRYNYLYWEGELETEYDFSEGFCVPGADTVAFLEDALAQLGLTRREANEFIVYWLPLMQENPYNLISFQAERYTDAAKLTVTPEPDTVIRVFMAWQGLKEPVQIAPQELTAPERTGFTLVEWGGTEVK